MTSMHTFARMTSTAALVAVALSAGAAHAMLVVDSITRSVTTQYLVGTTLVHEDTMSGGGTVDLAARVNTPLAVAQIVGPPTANEGRAVAVMSSRGLSQIELNAQMNSTAADDRVELRAEVTQTIVGAHLLAPRPATLAFDFELKDLFVEVWDAPGMASDARNPFEGPSDAVGAELRYQVLRDGVPAYDALLRVWGGRDDAPRLSTYADQLRPIPRLVNDEAAYDFGVDLFAQVVAGILTTGLPGDVPRRLDLLGGAVIGLDLGPIDPFESFEVTSTMSARMLLPAYMIGVGARVGIGDPNSLDVLPLGQVGLVDDTAPVPAPGTHGLLGLGLAGLAWFRYRPARPARAAAATSRG